MNGALGADWFNNTTQVMMGRQVQRDLANEALYQNAIVYEKIQNGNGLRIYAAPWSYALCGELNRLCADVRRPYDVADAVSYLHQYLRTTGKQSVKKSTIFTWCQNYRKEVNQAVLKEVDDAFYATYNARVIDWNN